MCGVVVAGAGQLLSSNVVYYPEEGVHGPEDAPVDYFTFAVRPLLCAGTTLQGVEPVVACIITGV